MKAKINTMLDKLLIKEIDQLIMDTGYYQAIEILLRLGILPHAKYEQWRMGKVRYLSETFSNKIESVNSLLIQAMDYVQSLDMVAEPVVMQQWQQNETSSDLQFCPADSILSNSLSVQYVRRKDIEQMDLFFDNQSLLLVNELKRALISRNIQIAGHKLQELYNLDSDHGFFVPAKKLLDALIDALEEEKISNTEQEMLYLLTELKPLAASTLSGQERDYMSLFWHRLANYIDDSAYTESQLMATSPHSAKMHSSFCYQQIPDWQAVISSIEKMPDGKKYPKLLARFAFALQKSGQRESYIQALCDYCWQFSNEYDDVPIAADITVRNIWHDFIDMELNEQWGLQHFPAWLLIKNPGLNHHINSNEYTPEEFKLLHKLILTEIKEKTPSIPLREQLNNSHNTMLTFYLENR